MKIPKNTTSPQTQQEALAVAKAIQKPSQTKEQTKLIAQGIEKGISLYKKQQKEKQREADKLRKKQAKVNNKPSETIIKSIQEAPEYKYSKLPWILLGLSWTGFILLVMFL